LIQGQFRDGDGPCLVAALSMASGNTGFDRPNRTERRLTKMLVIELPRNGGLSKCIFMGSAKYRMMMFNGHHRAAHKDALTMLEGTIEHFHAMYRSMPSHD
jgi:hypothetical protein